jgi:hypothetical protein
MSCNGILDYDAEIPNWLELRIAIRPLPSILSLFVEIWPGEEKEFFQGGLGCLKGVFRNV